jgi:DNA-binding MarR family transcriptional regulator
MGVSEYFFYLLYQAARQRDLLSDKMMKLTGLNIGRWRALAVIRRIENCTMSELALLSAVERTTLTRSVDQLVAYGLVERWTPPSDRRRVNLGLTEKGEAIYGEAVKVLLSNNAGVLDGVDPERVREATRLLQGIVAAQAPDPRSAKDLLSFGRPREKAG